MLFSMAAYITSFVVFFYFPEYIAAAGAMVLFACGEAFRTGTHKAMILEYLRLTGQTEWKTAFDYICGPGQMSGNRTITVLQERHPILAQP